MILGVGLDLQDVERIERAISKPHFLERIYSEEERAQIAKKGAQTAAGYFAAKEAVAKALGTGFAGLGPWDIEIVPDDLGRPRCTLSGGALARAEALCGKGPRVWLSITHENGMAAAMAILESGA